MAAKRCSAVLTLVSPQTIDVDLKVSPILSELGTTFGVPAKSILLNTMPVLGADGLTVTVDFLPECNATPLSVPSFRIVCCFI